ncbi:hypothetical protein WAI453_010345 [Rhynchosporium graminicola]
MVRPQPKNLDFTSTSGFTTSTVSLSHVLLDKQKPQTNPDVLTSLITPASPYNLLARTETIEETYTSLPRFTLRRIRKLTHYIAATMEKTTMWESTAIEKSAVREKPKDVQYQGEQPEGTIHLEKYKVAGFFIAYFFLGMIFSSSSATAPWDYFTQLHTDDAILSHTDHTLP